VLKRDDNAAKNFDIFVTSPIQLFK